MVAEGEELCLVQEKHLLSLLVLGLNQSVIRKSDRFHCCLYAYLQRWARSVACSNRSANGLKPFEACLWFLPFEVAEVRSWLALSPAGALNLLFQL